MSAPLEENACNVELGSKNEMFSELDQVFMFLLTQSCSINDDACLHKLKDLLKSHVTAASAVRDSGLDRFLHSVPEQASHLASPLLTFAVEVAGWLGAEEERYQQYDAIIQTLLSKALAIGLNNHDVSILTAVFNGFGDTVVHKTGFQWTIESDQGYIQQAWSLLTRGRSLFLEKAVVKFLKKAWIAGCQYEGEVTGCQSLMTFLQSRCLETVQKSVKKSVLPGKLLISTLSLIEEVSSSCQQVLKILFCDTELIQDLIELNKSAEERVSVVIGNILTCASSNRTCWPDRDGLLDSLQDLVSLGKVIRAQRLAAGILLQADIETGLRKKLGPLLLLPVRIATGRMTNCNGDSEDHSMLSSAVLEKLMVASKSDCVSIVCHSVTCLAKTGQLAVEQVSELLVRSASTCTELEPSTRDIHCYVAGNKKVQRHCLEYLLQAQGDVPKKVGIASALIHLIGEAYTDTVIYKLSTSCLLPWLEQIFKLEQQGEGHPTTIATQLATCVKHHLCALQWEVRDSTLEFLDRILFSYQDCSVVNEWVNKNNLHVQVWQSVTDGESYVRASALKCLSNLLNNDVLWSALLTQLNQTEGEVVGEVLNILDSDTEAFARRSAIDFVHTFYLLKKSGNLKLMNTSDTVEVIMKAVGKAISDFDWEVKLTVLKILDQVTSELKNYTYEDCCATDIPEYARGLLPGQQSKPDSHTEKDLEGFLETAAILDRLGCWATLQKGVGDFDPKVCERACKLTLKVQSHFQAVVGNMDMNTLKLRCDSVSVTPVDRSDGSGEPASKRSKVDCHSDGRTGSSLFESVSTLLAFDIERFKDGFCSSAAVSNDTNPLSLLQDILSYSRREEDDNAVDCY